MNYCNLNEAWNLTDSYEEQPHVDPCHNFLEHIKHCKQCYKKLKKTFEYKLIKPQQQQFDFNELLSQRNLIIVIIIVVLLKLFAK